MQLEYQNFAEALNRPKPERKEGGGFTRNFGNNQETAGS